MKVIFLGAGGSVDAGYPLTADLLNLMEGEYKSSMMINDRDDWKTFDDFRKGGENIFKEILHSPNPEVILSQIDLLETTLNEADAHWLKQFKEAKNEGNYQRLKELNKKLHSPVIEHLHKGRQAKDAITRLIDRFFSHRHYLDSQNGSTKREYLHRAMGLLDKGDVVIGTNWDTLSERILMEQEKWKPSDGYGFHFPIVFRIPRQQDEEIEQHSPVKLLKLHGSIGWHRKEEGDQPYLRHPLYLQYFHLPGCMGALHDRNAPPSGHGPDLNPVMIYPSYLKQLDDPIILEIWEQASYVLLNADEIFIIGYSLPKADVAIRALLIPLRARLERNATKVTVVNPNENNLAEWQRFLGDKVTLKQKTAGDYFE